jgi:polyisoprenoid-binding protein YceI
MSFVLSLLLASTPPPVATSNPSAQEQAVVRLGPHMGKLRFQAFSRLTDPFGQFDSWRGEVNIPGGDLTKASVMVRVEISTLDTDNGKRDAHLKNSDFFDVPKWPLAVFNAQGLKPLGKNRYQVAGKLKMMGVTKPISFPATVIWQAGKLSVKADFKLDRTTWGMTGFLSALSMNPIKKDVRMILDLKTP